LLKTLDSLFNKFYYKEVNLFNAQFKGISSQRPNDLDVVGLQEVFILQYVFNILGSICR
jgi:hypothetical protein